ncbi:iron chaperone [Alkalibacillus haloalkaliphilus]|uniref:iron chaperone n=1 Tax=Alkalibacillus haloalkaliphilus TaxID=94136 RepID=UPI002936C1F0|nr:iron chaperone [Alkalibacillus haloalkaliphilus]MDV2582353.1 iron chaperone [Alkalibacillus haloalkaliphilus]
MEVFADYLSSIDDEKQRERTEEVLAWVKGEFPQLEPVVKWNQPMFINNGTFIIAFSIAKQHMSVAPEKKALELFANEIEKVEYSATSQLFRIKWKDDVDYGLLRQLIEFNIEDKADYTKFWRE